MNSILETVDATIVDFPAFSFAVSVFKRAILYGLIQFLARITIVEFLADKYNLFIGNNRWIRVKKEKQEGWTREFIIWTSYRNVIYLLSLYLENYEIFKFNCYNGSCHNYQLTFLINDLTLLESRKIFWRYIPKCSTIIYSWKKLSKNLKSTYMYIVISFSHSTMNIQKVYKLDDKMMKVISRMCKIFLLLDDKNLIPLGKKHL